MKKLTKIGAGLLLSATMLSSAFADEITMWTMEEQPDRMARQQQIAADFNAATGHTVNVVAVTEKDIATRATAAFAAGELPDALNHTVQHLLPFAEAGILDAGAATDVVDELVPVVCAPAALYNDQDKGHQANKPQRGAVLGV